MSEQLDLSLADEPSISGLSYFEDFISIDEEYGLLENIDHQLWRSDLKRRVQHYGYIYDYKARSISREMSLGDLPKWLQRYSGLLVEQGYFSTPPDQVIINEYLPGQGISSHIDCLPCFGDTIASLSLSSAVDMDFTNPDKASHKIAMRLRPRSLIVLKGDARSKWQHGIAGRKTDNISGLRVARQRRVSLTFRSVQLAVM